MSFESIWQEVLKFSTAHMWVVKLAIIIVATLIASFIEKRIFSKLYPKLQLTSKIWDDSLLFSLHKPVRFLIWLSGFVISLEVILAMISVPDKFVRALGLLEDIVLLATFVWFLIRYFLKLEDRYIVRMSSRKKKIDVGTVHAVGQITRIFIVIIAVIMVLQIYGIPIAGLLAFGGIGGIALGFAAKDTLANFFGGFMIYFDRPFTVGDWIYSPDKNIEGTVESVGWRLTRIRGFDKRPIYVPNSVFSVIAVVNASRMTHRRIKADVGVRYADASKIPLITADIEKMLKEHPEIDSEQTCFVKFHQFADSSLNLQVYTFTKTTDWLKFMSAQQDVYLKIIEVVEKHGAECAFPTTTLDIPREIEIKSV